ncbi:MAG: NAD(P)-dependent oxidoreductase [Desulfofustis sp.]|jgi:3-hydroxyisobutyrate dehydrogenase-like beta-hydroxyacid dehydrogenase|nr:NAD(P)-dependent oxidoreductase [Desulfofustis sp.]
MITTGAYAISSAIRLEQTYRRGQLMESIHGTTIGFIGLGLMGRPMCANLISAGASLVVTNRSEGPRREMMERGAAIADTPAEVAARAQVLVIMVADTAAVESVLFGKNGVCSQLREGTLVIDMGTTAVAATREFAAQIIEPGGDYVDAPVSGGTIGAESGTLTIMAGGSQAGFNRALPVLQVLGGRITHVGAVGAGQVAKAANQVIVGLNIGAVAEALALAKAAGVDPGKVREALQGGFADSRILEVHGRRMVESDYRLGARCTTQRKDMHQALELAETLGLDMPATALSRDLYDLLIEAGGADLDHSALFRLLDIT